MKVLNQILLGMAAVSFGFGCESDEQNVADKEVSSHADLGTVGEPQSEPLQVTIHEKSNPELAFQQNGSVVVNFSARGLGAERAYFECRIGFDQTFVPCTSPVPLYPTQAGEVPELTVRALVDGQAGIEDTIRFDLGTPSGGGSFSMVNSMSLQIGNNYQFMVPEGMHVTEYSSTKTVNRSLISYRIMSDSDPLYVGNTRCQQYFERIVSAAGPNGQPLNYCESTPPSDEIHKIMTDYRWAKNHLSVATDMDRVAQDRSNYEMMMLNVFDADPEFMRARTRFWDLCENSIGGRLHVVRNVTMLRNFWGERVRADFWSCTAILTTPVPNGLPESNHYRIGTFFITDRDLGQRSSRVFPDMNCGNCTYDMPHMLEVVYAARANQSNVTPEYFAQTAMRRFEQHLMPAQ